MRFGADPVMEVKIPHVPPAHVPVSVLRSSQYGKIVYVNPVAGKQVLLKVEPLAMNCALPLESRSTLEKVWSYSLTGKGSAKVVKQSSQWLPVSVVPATIVPVAVATEYCAVPPQTVGVTVGVFVLVRVAVLVGRVPVIVGVGVPCWNEPMRA